MCFSAPASFISAGVLAAVGAASLFRVRRFPPLYALACIPLFFALQQLSEGMVWLSLEGTLSFSPYGNAAKSIFLFIAFIIWPFWIPFSLFVAEKEKGRKKILACFAIAGCLFALYNMYLGLTRQADVQILGKTLHYFGDWPNLTPYYLLLVALPCFLSSLKNCQIWGLLLLITASAALLIYEQTFVSVWCFFAAIASISLYGLLSLNANLETGNRIP